MDGVIYIRENHSYDDDQIDIFMDGVIYIKQKHIYDDNKIEVFMDHYQF